MVPNAIFTPTGKRIRRLAVKHHSEEDDRL